MQKRIPIATIFFLGLIACRSGDRPKVSEALPKPSHGGREAAQIKADSNGTQANFEMESPPVASEITPLLPSLLSDQTSIPPEAVVPLDFPDPKDLSSSDSSQPVIPERPIETVRATEPETHAKPEDSSPIVLVPIESLPPLTAPVPTPSPLSDPETPPPFVINIPAPEPAPVFVSVPAPLPEPIRVQPADDTYEAALAVIDQYRSDVAPFVNDNGSDNAKGTVWLGDGVNALNGERTPTCLNLANLSKQTTKIAQTHDNFEFVHNYYDFLKKMHNSVTVGGTGTFPWFTLGASVTTTSDHELYITKDDLLAVASFNYLREEQTLYNARPAFAPFFNKQLARNKGLFRSLCGDSYTKSVALGGTMRIVFSAKKRDQKKHNTDTVNATLSLGFNTLFSLNSSFGFSVEQQEILNSYSFSMKCYTSGTKANICADFGLNTSFDFKSDGVSLQERMDAARKRMAADVDSGENLVIVGEKFADYETPISMCTLEGDEACPSTEKVYYNYHPRVDTAFRILNTLEKMEEICTTTSYWKNRCNSVRSQLTDAMRKCAQSSGPCEELRDRTQVNILLSAASPGRFSLWTDTHRRGDIYGNDFKGGDATGKFSSNTFYTLSSIGWDRLNDKASSLEVHLAPGWTLRFWEHKQEDRRGNSLDVRDDEYISNLWKMNDKISSFELIPPPDFGD